MSGVRRIALVGLPGSGKSTIAPLVARGLGWDAVDLDDEIARTTGRSPAAIIAEDGESAFRDLELAALEDHQRLGIAQLARRPRRSKCVVQSHD